MSNVDQAAFTKTTLRVSLDDLAEIDRRAHRHGLSRTRFLITLGLGKRLPLVDAEGLTGRVEILERQMKRLALRLPPDPEAR